MDDAHKLLVLLANGADGATQRELMITHKFAPGLIYRCVEQELIMVHVQTVDARSVFRFYITEVGRAFLDS